MLEIVIWSHIVTYKICILGVMEYGKNGHLNLELFVIANI